jgi:hypothetical protein
MPARRRKNDHCLNCQHPLASEDNYCASCGQENNDRKVSMRELVHDVLNSLFSYDSQLFRSIVPFLFRPGRLTLEFLAGRRKKYIHPLRLYFAMSLLFFLVITPQLAKIEVEKDNESQKSQGKEAKTDTLSGKTRIHIVTPAEKKEIALNDSLSPIQIATNSSSEKAGSVTDTLADIRKNGWLSLLDGDKNKMILSYIRQHKLSNEALLDSLHQEKHFMNRLLAQQSLKLAEEGGVRILWNFLLGKLPLMMFLLMPIVALMLKILYLKIFSRMWKAGSYYLSALGDTVSQNLKESLSSKRLMMAPDPRLMRWPAFSQPSWYYIEHLIFTINLHSFAFLILSISFWVLDNLKGDWPGSIAGLLTLLCAAYIWLSFYRMYRENWLKTTFKLFVLSIGYMICLSLSFLCLLAYSYFTY